MCYYNNCFIPDEHAVSYGLSYVEREQVLRNSHLRMHNFKKRTQALGPGERFAIWLQGCDKRCLKCMTPSSQDLNGGTLVLIEELAKLILNEKNLEGITVSGGEPFIQAKPLHAFLRIIREQSTNGIIVYTGYYLEELLDMNMNEINEIIYLYSDLIIDGPYINELNDNKSLRGSSNQNIHLTSNRYIDTVNMVYNQPKRKAEIYLNNEEALLVGIPDIKSYELWKTVFPKL